MSNAIIHVGDAVLAVVRSRQDNEQGAAAAEYGLLLALVAIVIAVGLGVLGVNLNALFEEIAAFFA